jgi:AraC family transcriptional regulator
MLERVALLYQTVRSASTVSLWQGGVERAIVLMHDRSSEKITLRQLAKTAAMSPFHFERVFRLITGLSPFQFLSALRIARACERLLAGDESVTEIGLGVGYSSIGTFTRRFTKLVGVSPRRIRYLSRDGHARALSSIAAGGRNSQPGGGVDVGVTLSGVPMPCFAVVGAFSTPLPFGRPLAGGAAIGSSHVRLLDVPQGPQYLFALASSSHTSPVGWSHDSVLIGASGERPLAVDATRHPMHIEIRLRRLVVIDPPLLIHLPLLIQRGLV